MNRVIALLITLIFGITFYCLGKTYAFEPLSGGTPTAPSGSLGSEKEKIAPKEKKGWQSLTEPGHPQKKDPVSTEDVRQPTGKRVDASKGSIQGLAILQQKRSLLIHSRPTEVVLADGTILFIPPNTVDTDTAVRLIQAEAPTSLREKGLLSDVYYIQSEDRPRIQGSFSLSIPYDGSRLPRGASERDLQGYGMVDGDILFTVPSKVDPARKVVVFQEPDVMVLRNTPEFRSGNGPGSGSMPVGYAIGFPGPDDQVDSPQVCIRGSRGETHQTAGNAFKILLTTDADCGLVRYLADTLQEAMEVYNRDFRKQNGDPPFKHLGPDNRMSVFVGDYAADGEYKPWSWNGYITIDSAKANAKFRGERELLGYTLYHEMFHALQDIYSNMLMGGVLAKWWYEATASWSEIHYAGKPFRTAANTYLRTYHDFLSTPLEQSGELGRQSFYAYSLLIRHVEQVQPGSVKNMLNSWNVTSKALYDALITQGDLVNTYADFVREILLVTRQGTGIWSPYSLVLTGDEFLLWEAESYLQSPDYHPHLNPPLVRIGETPVRIGERRMKSTEIRGPGRYRERILSLGVLPMTTVFIKVDARQLQDPHNIKLALLDDRGMLSTNAWITKVRFNAAQLEPTRMPSGKMEFPVHGHECLLAVFNPEPYASTKYQLSIQLDKQGPAEAYQGTIVMGMHDRLPPRAFALRGTNITPDADTVKFFLDTGRYNDTFGFTLLPCTVQIRSFEGEGTYDADTGAVKGWYQLAYEYTGPDAARCRETRGTLVRDTAIVLGRKPAFGGERVEFTGTIDSRGIGKVTVSFSDGRSGTLDVAPFQ